MRTRVPGPRSRQLHPDKIIWSERLERTNIWDVDGNRFLDLTSGGGALPFGYVDEGTIQLDQLNSDFSGYEPCLYRSDRFNTKKILHLGARITCAFSEPEEQQSLSMAELAKHNGEGVELVWVGAQYMDPVSLRNVASWCQKFGIQWVSDEREMGLFRTGLPFVAAAFEPNYILASLASEKFKSTELLYTRDESNGIEGIRVAKNYADADLTRTIRLQSMELSELLKDTISDRELSSVGSYHSIDMGSAVEAKRVYEGLLQRGIIVARMNAKVVLLPSLYLALGEIVFAVNQIRLVVANRNEMETPWVTEQLREL